MARKRPTRLVSWAREAMYAGVENDAPVITDDVQRAPCANCVRMFKEADRLVDRLVRVQAELIEAQATIEKLRGELNEWGTKGVSEDG